MKNAIQLIENELNKKVVLHDNVSKDLNKYVTFDQAKNKYSLVVRVDEPREESLNDRQKEQFKNSLGFTRTYWAAPNKTDMMTVKEFKEKVEKGQIILESNNVALIDVSENKYAKQAEYNNRFEVYYLVRHDENHIVMVYDRIKYKGILEGYGYLEDDLRSKGSTDRVHNVADIEIADKYSKYGKFNEYGEYARIDETDNEETYVHIQDLYIYPHNEDLFNKRCLSLAESTQDDYKNQIIQVNDVISYGLYEELEGFEGE